MNALERKIELVPIEEISSFVEKAKRISPDEKDVPYIALALRKNISIWSNDKELKEKQDIIKVYNTQEILSFIHSNA